MTMHVRGAAVALTAAAALVLTPMAVAFAAPNPTHGTPASHSTHAAHPVKARFVISKLVTLPSRNLDVKAGAVTLKFAVQVKDFDKKFDPKSVSILVAEKGSTTGASNITVKTRLVGKSKVVSNWRGTLTIAQGSIPAGTKATYCVSLVKVDPTSTAVLPVLASAKGLAGRDCFTIMNSATPAP